MANDTNDPLLSLSFPPWQFRDAHSMALKNTLDPTSQDIIPPSATPSSLSLSLSPGFASDLP